jgi:4'-phosphopantetheinyl transferase
VTTVDVRLVPVVAGAAEDPVLYGRLCDGDHKATRALGFAADRDRAVTARAAARLELARRLGIEPRLVPLLAPDVSGGRAVVVGTTIGISWSHSGDWVALALARDRPVGIDIELVPGQVPVAALARLGVASLDEFVAREAAGKATGEGLAVRWPCALTVRPFDAPPGYVGAVAAPGDDWAVTVEPWEPRDPPASASAHAIGLWDTTGAGSRRTATRAEPAG